MNAIERVMANPVVRAAFAPIIGKPTVVVTSTCSRCSEISAKLRASEAEIRQLKARMVAQRERDSEIKRRLYRQRNEAIADRDIVGAELELIRYREVQRAS